ncbi:eukaryotic translation initiation factor 4B2-like [Populus alba x Populus x berolinensis]|nr:eukaryotic translation initiation factor 4B2-like [Populus alba x Populus x berolinensis]
MSKKWGKIGAWAADSEQAEEEERAAAAAAVSQSFPSLKEAAGTAKPKKKKMSLNEFYSTPIGGVVESKGLTPDEMFRLPTGPKERSAEEMQHGHLGGGFSNYGRTGPPPGRMRDRDNTDGSWGGGGGGRRQFGGGFDDERRGQPPSRVSDYDQPSRADEVDNWAMAKKPLPSFDSGRQSRYSSLGGGGGDGGGSRADEVDNWAVGKKPLPTRPSTFGSGFGPEPDRSSRGGYREPERERPRLVLNPPRMEVVVSEPVKTNRSNPFGTARPREDVLAEKGLDWKKLEMEMEAKKNSSLQSSRPTSAHSSRPSSAQSNRSEGPGLLHQGFENVAVKPRPRVNPFGEAKPRELLLQERGQDWIKIDRELEHRGVDRPETEEEKLLKEQIEHLKTELEKATKVNQEPQQVSVDDLPSLREMINEKERELEILVRDLDDKVRFGPKAIDRPGSGAGRSPGFSERPPSRPGSFGSFDESRSMEFMDRPRSRGKPDIWTRPADERRSLQGGRERGFLGSRDFDRQRTGKW